MNSLATFPTVLAEETPIGMAVKLHSELRGYEKNLLNEKLELMEGEHLLKNEKRRLWERIVEFQQRVKAQEELAATRTSDYRAIVTALKDRKDKLKRKGKHKNYRLTL